MRLPAVLATLLLPAAAAVAQPTFYPGNPVSRDNPLPTSERCASGSIWVACEDQAKKVVDPNNASYIGAEAVTVGATVPPARALIAICTAAGNVSVRFPDASTLVMPVPAGSTMLPFAVTRVDSAGTTATCTYANLK